MTTLPIPHLHFNRSCSQRAQLCKHACVFCELISMNHEHMKLYSQKTILCKDKLVVLTADRSSGYFDCIQAGGTTTDNKICSIVWFPIASYPGRVGGERRPGIDCLRRISLCTDIAHEKKKLRVYPKFGF